MANQKPMLLIDGENFMHRLFDLLKSQKKIHQKHEIISYDLDGLLAEVISIAESANIVRKYFGTRIRHQSQDNKVQEHTEKLIQSQRRWKRYIEDRGTEFVYAGNLRLREGKPCRHCGKSTQYFVEKGVDVAIATELLRLATDKFKGQVYLLSSDSDLLPAIRVALAKGLKITYIATETSINLALSKTIKKTRTISEKHLVQYWKMTQ